MKAFLRTEEKKREKDRQTPAPPIPSVPTPAPAPVENDAGPTENSTEESTTREQTHASDASISEIKSDEVAKEGPIGNAEDSVVDPSAPELSQVTQVWTPNH